MEIKNTELIGVDEDIRLHPIEVVGKQLREDVTRSRS
ncbi:MAG: hypothetical protein ACJA2Q_001015 [Pseudohongiellaceae bacterium]|jgi:hypothetical protein